MTPNPTITPTPLRFDDLIRSVEKNEEFLPLVAALRAGRSGSIDGAWGSSAALAAAALGLRASDTLLVVIAFPRDLDGWSEDIATFAGMRPVIFPAWDRLAEDDDAFDEIAGQRLRVLKQLESSRPPRFVLTTIQALLQPVPNRAQLARGRRTLKAGDQIDIEKLSRWLVEHGYKRTEAVELPGEFSRRGGILDVFSPDADAPHRLEFFGDEVESIRQFNAQTQRSLGNTDSVELLGTQTAMGSAGAAEPGNKPTGHLCDYLASGS